MGVLNRSAGLALIQINYYNPPTLVDVTGLIIYFSVALLVLRGTLL